MEKFKKTTIWLKENFLNLLVLGMMFFCLFNIFNRLDDSVTVIANSLAVFLAIWYFIQFEKEKIKKIAKKLFTRHLLENFEFLPNKKNLFLSLVLKSRLYLLITIRFLYKKRWELISYLFILLLLIITLGQFSFLKKFIDLSWVKKYQAIIIVLAVISGGLTMWHNRKRVEKEIEEEKNEEEKAEEKRKEEFSEKFPGINKIPVLRNLVKWIYKEKITSFIILLLLVITGVILVTHKISTQSINVDEGIISIVSDNINSNIGPTINNGVVYSRGYTYTYPTSLIYSLFGKNEITTRSISIIFFIFSIILFYWLSKKILKNKNYSLISTFLFVILPVSSQFSRFARMYSINLFIQLLVILLLIYYYQFRKIQYIFLSILVFIFGFLTHNIFIFSFLAYALSLTIIELKPLKKFLIRKKRLSIIIFCTLITISPIILEYFKSSTKIDILSNVQWTAAIADIFLNQYSYLAILLLFLIITTIFAITEFFKKNKNNFNFFLVINIIIPFILIELMIYSNFPSYRIRYIYHLLPLLIIIFLANIQKLYKIKKIYFILVPILAIIFILNINLNILENKQIINYDIIKNIKLQKGDIVISNNPIVSQFYMGRTDYWLIKNQNEINLYSYLDSNDIRRYAYTNSMLVSNSFDLKKIVSQNHGYIILDPSVNKFTGNSFIKEIIGTNDNVLYKQKVTILAF